MSAHPFTRSLARLAQFPNPVNEYAARFTAGMVVLMSLAALLSQQGWILLIITAGFAVRVLAGPRFSVAGQLSVRVLAPRLGRPKLVPGPPKRFAQGIGLLVSGTASVLFYTGQPAVAWLLTGILIVAAGLESLLGFCLGCAIFARLQQAGLIPASVCEACSNFVPRTSAQTGAHSG